jgi:hypothetical protein
MKWLFIFLIAVLIPLESFAQIDSDNQKQQGFLISENNPPIYITFERFGEKSDRYKDKIDKVVWLSLHNNTKCAISFFSIGLISKDGIKPVLKEANVCNGVVQALQDKSEIDIVYNICRSNNSRQIITKKYPHNMFLAKRWLLPGQSIFFRVKKSELAQRFAICIPINYEFEWIWEEGNPIKLNSNQINQIYFFSRDLPEDINQ